jgi:hypothetical protein
MRRQQLLVLSKYLVESHSFRLHYRMRTAAFHNDCSHSGKAHCNARIKGLQMMQGWNKKCHQSQQYSKKGSF